MKKKKIIRILQWIAIVYGVIGIALHAFQDKILFHPEVLDTNYKFNFEVPFDEVFLPVSNTDTIHLVHFKTSKHDVKGNILYFHGNRKNIAYYFNRVPNFLAAGYDVWMPDYFGFGKSRGALTEENLNLLADQAFRYASSQSKSDLIVYGRSLGTGLASYVSSQYKVKKLILETPYSSIPSLFNRYAFIYPVNRMCNFKLSNFDYLQSVKAPIYIFHGEKDGVIPIKEAARLKKVLKSGDQFIEIENGSHNDISNFPEYKNVMEDLLR